MSHFSVVVCTDDPAKLDALMAPYDENLEVALYRDYEDGEPAAYWAVKTFREKAGLNPDDATLTWAQVAEVHNKLWTDERPMLIAEDGRAYNMSTRNPDSNWDYWRIGGRWGGYFPYRAERAAHVLRPKRGWDSPDVKPMHCDGGPKGALDLDRLRQEKADLAREKHAEFAALVAGTPEARSWAQFLADRDAGHLTIDEARDLYHAQPRVQAISETDYRWHDDPLGTFGQPVERYVLMETARAVPGYAVVRTDGAWMAKGRMGWFGVSHDDDNEAGYLEVANGYIESLPDEVYLIVTDCHV